MTTVIVNEFDGGQTNDPRDTAGNVARISQHIDNANRKHLLTPYPDNKVVDSAPDTLANLDSYKIQKFLYSPTSISTNVFFGLGVQSTTKPAIYTKSLHGDAWAIGSTTGDYASLAALGSAPPFFIYYRDYLYGVDGTVGSRNWWKYGGLSAPTWTRALNAIENTTSPIVHSKDDTLYYGNGAGTGTINQVGKLLATSFTNTALIFPLYSKIASLCEYGDYLAIALNNPDDRTFVHLWDRDSSVATTSVKIDWGSGTIKWIESVGGVLIGCSISQPTAALSLYSEVVFKYYNGVEAVEFARFTCTNASAVIYPDKQKYNNIVYFMAEMQINGVENRGIWKVVKSPSGSLSVSFDRLPWIDYTIATTKLYGFLRTGDYFHIACDNTADAGTYIITKTALTTFGATATYRTTINPNMPPADRTKKKQLMGLAISMEPQLTGESCLAYYRVDGGSWIPALYDATDGVVTSEFVNAITTPSGGVFTADGNYTAGREYEFRLDIAGGLKVTEIKYRYEVLDTLL